MASLFWFQFAICKNISLNKLRDFKLTKSATFRGYDCSAQMPVFADNGHLLNRERVFDLLIQFSILRAKIFKMWTKKEIKLITFSTTCAICSAKLRDSGFAGCPVSDGQALRTT
jgi:hypothetical protein